MVRVVRSRTTCVFFCVLFDIMSCARRERASEIEKISRIANPSLRKYLNKLYRYRYRYRYRYLP